MRQLDLTRLDVARLLADQDQAGGRTADHRESAGQRPVRPENTRRRAYQDTSRRTYNVPRRRSC
jgi:hypothetical protein